MKIVEKFIIETIGGKKKISEIKKKIKEELFGKDAYIEQLEDFLYTNKFSLKVPSTYIFFHKKK